MRLPKSLTKKRALLSKVVPVVTAAADPDALEVIRATAQAQRAPLTIVTAAETQKPPLDAIEVPLRGEHQRLNAALVLATVRALEKDIPVGEEAICEGITNVQWSGRFQVIKRANQTFVLDGAHNLAGAEALRAVWQKCFGDQQPALVFGMLADKDWARMCEVLAPLASRVLLVPVNSERTAPPTELASPCRQSNPDVDVVPCDSLSQAFDRLDAEPLVLVTGSLYLVGETLQQLQASDATVANERGLNEWQAVPDRP
jgi:dihydrofolate synthase/folylpolyglutamate synthase